MVELESFKKIKSLEIQILSAQMNPHFVFNCLSAIQHLFLKGNKAEANAKLSNFSKLLRLSIDHVKNDFIPLESELTFLKYYIDLEQLQFEDAFQYTLLNNCKDALDNLQIPSMILQPYVENAINHGLKNKNDTKTLTISIDAEDTFIIVTIEDNGIGRIKAQEIKAESTHNHVSRGLTLVQEKIEIIMDLYNEFIDVKTIDKFSPDNQPNGTKVLIRFNKRLII